MAKGKGSSVVFIKDIVKVNKLEGQFIEQLTIEERTNYDRALAISWIDIDIIDSLFTKTVKLLYPEMAIPKGLRKLQSLMAEKHFAGLYKILLKVVTIPTLINQVAKIWRQYNDTGQAFLTDNQKSSLLFRVIDFPDMSDAYGESLCGYIEKMIEMAGGKDVGMTKTRTAEGFDWHIRWK